VLHGVSGIITTGGSSSAVLDGVLLSVRRRARGSVLHGVPEEILEELQKPALVGIHLPQVGVALERRPGGVDVPPRGTHAAFDVDEFGLADGVTVFRERQDVVDQAVYPV